MLMTDHYKCRWILALFTQSQIRSRFYQLGFISSQLDKIKTLWIYRSFPRMQLPDIRLGNRK